MCAWECLCVWVWVGDLYTHTLFIMGFAKKERDGVRGQAGKRGKRGAKSGRKGERARWRERESEVRFAPI